MVETFFKTIKSALIWPIAWQTRQQAETPSPDASTGSITLSGGIHRSACMARSHSSGRHEK
jgi:hypothetical protein